jgi:hypothetical protein
MDYAVAIPSYKRADTLKTHTLATLERHGVRPERITIFLANAEEEVAYRKVIPAYYKIVVAKPGKFNAVKWYNTEHYPQGTMLLNIDDDITRLDRMTADGKLTPFTGKIETLVRMGFDLCDRYGTTLWGINPVANGFYMNPNNTIGLRFICGNFYGSYAGDYVITNSKRRQFTSGDDFETTIQAFIQNGSVVRLDWIAPMTKMFAPGGIDAELKDNGIQDRQTDNTQALLQIANKYPDLVRVVTKAGGITSLRLKVITVAKEPILL